MKVYRIITSEVIYSFYKWEKWVREWLMQVHKAQSQTPNMVLLSIVCALLLVINCSVAAHSFLDPMDCSPPGFCIHEILQSRILESVAISFSREASQPRDRTHVSCFAGRFFTIWAIREVSVCALESNKIGPFLLNCSTLFIYFFFETNNWFKFSKLASWTENKRKTNAVLGCMLVSYHGCDKLCQTWWLKTVGTCFPMEALWSSGRPELWNWYRWAEVTVSEGLGSLLRLQACAVCF